MPVSVKENTVAKSEECDYLLLSEIPKVYLNTTIDCQVVVTLSVLNKPTFSLTCKTARFYYIGGSCEESTDEM